MDDTNDEPVELTGEDSVTPSEGEPGDFAAPAGGVAAAWSGWEWGAPDSSVQREPLTMEQWANDSLAAALAQPVAEFDDIFEVPAGGGGAAPIREDQGQMAIGDDGASEGVEEQIYDESALAGQMAAPVAYQTVEAVGETYEPVEDEVYAPVGEDDEATEAEPVEDEAVDAEAVVQTAQMPAVDVPELEPQVAGIVVAAGTGQRLGADVPKGMIEINDHPLYQWAAEALRRGGCNHVVIVVPGDWVSRVSDVEPEAVVVAGGATRQQSVALGLKALASDPPDIVVVHDAARALAPVEVVSRVLDEVRAGHHVVTAVLPVSDTVRQVTDDGSVVLDRELLGSVQTPQAANYDTLRRAHNLAAGDGTEATDDVTLCERLGEDVWMAEGDPKAFKITTPFDLTLARVLVG